MASSHRSVTRQNSPVLRKSAALQSALSSHCSSEYLGHPVRRASTEREHEAAPRGRNSQRSSSPGSPAYEEIPPDTHDSFRADSQITCPFPTTPSKSIPGADIAPGQEATKEGAKSPKRKRSSKSAGSLRSGRPKRSKVRSKSGGTFSSSRSASVQGACEQEDHRSEKPLVKASVTPGHDQTTRPSPDFVPEEDARRITIRSPSESQAPEQTELLTESRLRLEYFVLLLGATIAIGVVVILVLRFVSSALASHFTGIVFTGRNDSETSEVHPSARTYCLDAGACKDAYTSVLRESVDANADPCHNFYSYACGGWLRSHEESTAMTAWRQYTNDVIERLRIERVSTRMQSEPVGQAARFLEACLKVGSKVDPGSTAQAEVRDVLAEAGLNWPGRSEHSGLVNTLFFMARRVGLPIFFDVDTGYANGLRALFFRLDSAFQKTVSFLVNMLNSGSLSKCVRVMYRIFVDGVANETRLDEVVSGLKSLAGVLEIYLQASDDRSTVQDIASLNLYAPPVSLEMWASSFRKYFNFEFAELDSTVIYDVRSFSAIFRYVLVHGEAGMKDASGFLGIVAAVSYTSSEIRDVFFGSSKDASFHQEQHCSLSSYMFYGDALNHFFFEKARAELETFAELQELMWKEFPRIIGPNSTLIGDQEPLPRDNHLNAVSEFLQKSELKVFLPRYRSYPNLTKSALRNWIALSEHKRKLGFAYTGVDVWSEHSNCAGQCDATIFKWRLTPYHLTFPWYSPWIHRGILFAGLATRIAAAIFVDYVDRSKSRRERLYEVNQKCLRSVNPELGEAPDVGLQASVAAVLASSALLGGRYGQNIPLVDFGADSRHDVGGMRGSQVFFAFGCYLLCGDEDAERLCNVPLRHSVDFARAFNCKEGTIMNPRHKCRLRV
ncbi:hypothetical protein HPB50_003431 [Hyalomma asiaticum]|uniref:Uncharacterized protein n=1 Tax=Hyalomma asiaticum TaxID=266040 RepID=A0ACB7RHD0_HYAAI|nr:hypothetical protein HPB50_003431 [Hyalomma asiaticum]